MAGASGYMSNYCQTQHARTDSDSSSLQCTCSMWRIAIKDCNKIMFLLIQLSFSYDAEKELIIFFLF